MSKISVFGMGAELELLLQRHRLVPVGAELDTRQHAHVLHGHVNALDPFRDRHVATLQADGELPVRVLRKRVFIDVGNGLAPAVEELHGVVTSVDLGDCYKQAAFLVHGRPGLGVGNVEIRIRPLHLTGLAMHQHVPLEAFLEVELLLT
jgi:hypothetical protein